MVQRLLPCAHHSEASVNSCLQPGQVHSKVGQGESLRLGEGMETGQHFTCPHLFVASSTKGVTITTFSWDQKFSYNLLLISRPFGAQFNKNVHLTHAERHTGVGDGWTNYSSLTSIKRLLPSLGRASCTGIKSQRCTDSTEGSCSFPRFKPATPPQPTCPECTRYHSFSFFLIKKKFFWPCPTSWG